MRKLAALLFYLSGMALGFALASWLESGGFKRLLSSESVLHWTQTSPAPTGVNSGPPKDDPSDMRMTAECHLCHKGLYRDGPVWRHTEGADPLFPHWASPIPPGTAQHLVEGSFE